MKKGFATVHGTGARLRTGMVVRLIPGGPLYRVVFVNECRAKCEPLERTRKVEIKHKFGEEGAKTEFTALARDLDISPNADVEIVSHQ
jgi:hypothetical protein